MALRNAIRLLTLLLIFAAGAAADSPGETLKAGDITIAYPCRLEKQAKEVAAAASKAVARIKQPFEESKRALSDNQKIAKRICELTGCPEYLDSVGEVLAQYRLADVVSSMLTNVRILRVCDFDAQGVFKEDPWVITYDRKNDRAKRELRMDNSSSFSATFLPVCVNDDGAFTTDSVPLEESLATCCEIWAHMLELPIHEATEIVIGVHLDLHNPFTRWFNDGIANWVMLKIVSEMAPEWEVECRKRVLPKPDDPLKPKINLLTWVQDSYKKINPSTEEADISTASYRYATEMIDRMLSDEPPDTLAKILQKLKGRPYADTFAICTAIKEVTGKDAGKALIEYTPDHVRQAVKDPSIFTDVAKQAFEAAEGGEYTKAVPLLSKLLDVLPSEGNTRLNLAWAMRKAGMPKCKSEWHIELAAAPQGKTDLKVSMVADDADAAYVVGRYFQLCSSAEKARELLEKALKHDPNHADAKTALKELVDCSQ